MRRPPEALLRPRLSAQVTLLAVIALASSFPYFFVGPMPAWLFLGIVSAMIGIFHRRLAPCVLGAPPIFLAIVLWLLLILYTFILHVSGYRLDDISSGPVLSLFTALTFLGVLTTASYTSSTTTSLAIFGIAFLQGSIAILQFIGFGWAWDLPDTITSTLSIVAKAPEIMNWELSELGFDAYGRARGTHHFIHIFNGIQVALFAFCVFVRFHTTDRKLWTPSARAFMSAAILLALAGLLLTFSRSGLLGATLALIVTVSYRLRTKRTFRVLSMGLIFCVLLVFLNFDDAEMFSRLTYFDPASINDASRIEHLRYALDNFSRSPLIGASGLRETYHLELPIHSVPLRYLNDFGLIGLILYMGVFGSVMLFYIEATRSHDGTVSMWGACGVAVSLAIIADSWTHSSGFMRRDIIHAILLALVAGNIIAARRRVLMHRFIPVYSNERTTLRR